MSTCCQCDDECTVDRTGYYTFTVAGVTGDDCSYANRGYCLAYDRCDCLGEVWKDSGDGEPFQALLFLKCSGGSQTARVWIGRIPDEMPLAVYELAWGSWTAAGPNVLTRTDANATCGDWPATISVSKSGSCATEDCGCADTTTKAAAFEFTISGMADNGCYCDPFNRTWCIAYGGFCSWAGSYEVLGCYPGAPLLADYVFCTLEAQCSDDQTCGADLYLGAVILGSTSGFSGYHCDAFSCETGGVFTCVGSSHFCSATPTLGFPTTITLTPSEICTPDPLPCQCTPKSNYSPRIEIRGILDESCDDCSCSTDLSLCFTAYGAEDTDCLWESVFTFPAGEPVACTSTATHAILNLFDGDVVSLTFYDVSENIVARYEASLYDFDCQASDFPLHRTYQNDTCTWPADDTLLYMLGDECPTCSCDAGSWAVSIVYDGTTYDFCLGVSPCDGVSTLEEISGAGGDGLYVEVEFGTLPAQFARLRVYYLNSGDTIGMGTLIGVYNFLSDFSAFSCNGASNTMSLATGNAGQCGYLIDETGFTENLDGSAFINSEPGCCTPASYETPGTYNYVTVSGVTYIAECWGAGGGGKGGTADNRNGAGGGGAYSKTTWVGDGSTLTVTVGSGGAAGYDAAGSAGGDASVGSLCVAKGGSGGDSSSSMIPGGLASAGTGDTKYNGGDGGYGGGGSGGGGAGGSSAGTAADGNDGETGDSYTSPQPIGGAAPTGGGAGGDGSGDGEGNTNGSPGQEPGGGGGAGYNSGDGLGAAGAAGKVVISCG